MLEVLGEQEHKTLTEKLLANVREACKQKSDTKHRDALWRAAAMLISSKTLNRQLLQCITSSQVGPFSNVFNKRVLCVYESFV